MVKDPLWRRLYGRFRNRGAYLIKSGDQPWRLVKDDRTLNGVRAKIDGAVLIRALTKKEKQWARGDRQSIADRDQIDDPA